MAVIDGATTPHSLPRGRALRVAAGRDRASAEPTPAGDRSRVPRDLPRVRRCSRVALVAVHRAADRVSAAPAIARYGSGFLSGRVWDPNTERYGILAEVWGTLYTSVLSLDARHRVRRRARRSS